MGPRSDWAWGWRDRDVICVALVEYELSSRKVGVAQVELIGGQSREQLAEASVGLFLPEYGESI